MAQKNIHILCVGKTKNTHYKALVAEYAKRIAFNKTLVQTEVADCKYAKTILEGQAYEAKNIIAKLANEDVKICLDENGKNLSSVEFTNFIENLNKRPCFIIGGAYGLHQSVKDIADYSFSFGKMTLPHELAKVVLYEQLYRAECILKNSPYHH